MPESNDYAHEILLVAPPTSAVAFALQEAYARIGISASLVENLGEAANLAGEQAGRPGGRPAMLVEWHLPGLRAALGLARRSASTPIDLGRMVLEWPPWVVPDIRECLRNYLRLPQRQVAAWLGLRVPRSQVVRPTGDWRVGLGKIAHLPGRGTRAAGELIREEREIVEDEIVPGTLVKVYASRERILHVECRDPSGKWRVGFCEDCSPSNPVWMAYLLHSGALYGSTDFVVHNGEAVFLEFNPCPGLAPAEHANRRETALEVARVVARYFGLSAQSL